MCDTKKPKLIEIGKKYTYNGHPARVICVDRNGEYSVVALVTYSNWEDMLCFTQEGVRFPGQPSHSCLEEVPPYADWKVDDKILVAVSPSGPWYKAHFSHEEDGVVMAFNGQRTSWSSTGVEPWGYGKRLE